MTSNKEHQFTSTGIKFWRHSEQLQSYYDNEHNTIISTHISPEGRCNLKCSYCSVANRKVNYRISLERIQKYIIDLKTRGLKAVIITGGGEPTLYPQINELIRWIKLDQQLSVAMITNGTQTHRIHNDVWNLLSWVRVSINTFKDYKNVIKLPYHLVSNNCIVGCSFVITSYDDIKLLQDVAQVATNCGSQYIRVLPNCLLNENSLLDFHKQLEEALIQLNDQRFFRQNKVFAIPDEEICHQSFFRPYLSEVPWKEDGEPGSVYPCDSVVLNDAIAKFDEKFQLTKLENILEYLNGNIIPNFMPKHDCKNCVFTKNVKLLGDFKRGLIDDRTNYQLPIIHEEFV